MTLSESIGRLGKIAGVVAIAAQPHNGNLVMDFNDVEVARVAQLGGRDYWVPILRAAVQLYGYAQNKEMRIIMADEVLLVLRAPDKTVVAVLLLTGHSVHKSIRRFIRNAFKAMQAGKTTGTTGPGCGPPLDSIVMTDHGHKQRND